MADNISELYNKALEKGVLAEGLTEDMFRKQTATDEGLRSFYDYASDNGMKLRPWDDFRKKARGEAAPLQQAVTESVAPAAHDSASYTPQAGEVVAAQAGPAQSAQATPTPPKQSFFQRLLSGITSTPESQIAEAASQALSKEETAANTLRRQKSAQLPASEGERQNAEELRRKTLEGMDMGTPNGSSITYDADGNMVFNKTTGTGAHLYNPVTGVNRNQEEINRLKKETPSFLQRPNDTEENVVRNMMEAYERTEEGKARRDAAKQEAEDIRQALQKDFENTEEGKDIVARYQKESSDAFNAMYGGQYKKYYNDLLSQYQQEFNQSDEYKNIVAQYQAGKMSAEQAEDALDKAFKKLYGEKYKQETNRVYEELQAAYEKTAQYQDINNRLNEEYGRAFEKAYGEEFARHLGDIDNEYIQSVIDANKDFYEGRMREIRSTLATGLIDKSEAEVNNLLKIELSNSNAASQAMRDPTYGYGNSYGAEDEYIRTAKSFLNKAKARMSAVKKDEYHLGDFSKNMGMNMKSILESTMTYGLSDVRDAAILKSIFEKASKVASKDQNADEVYDNLEAVLNDKERAVYNAYAAMLAAEIARAGDTSYLSDAARLTAEMIPFMLEVGTMNGIFGGLNAAARNGVARGLTRKVIDKLPKSALRRTRGVRGLAMNLTTAGMYAGESAAMALVLPRTYAKMMENEIGVARDEDGAFAPGAIDYSKGHLVIKDFDVNDKPEAFMDAYKEQWKELFTETGGLITPAANIVLKNPIAKKTFNKFKQTSLGHVVDMFSSGKFFEIANQLGYQGVYKEWLEEVEGTGWEYVFGDKNAFEKFFKKDTQIPMLMSFAVPSVIGGGVNAGRELYYRQEYKNAGHKILDIIGKYGFTDEDLAETKKYLYTVPIEDLPREIIHIASVYTDSEQFKNMYDEYVLLTNKEKHGGLDKKEQQRLDLAQAYLFNGKGASEDAKALADELTRLAYAEVVLSSVDHEMGKERSELIEEVRQYYREEREEQARMKKSQEEVIQQEASNEVDKVTHSNGMIYRVAMASDPTKQGYIIRGNVFVKGDDPTKLQIANKDVVTVKFDDDTVKQMAASDLDLLEAPSPAEAVKDVVTAERLVANESEQTFQVGQEVLFGNVPVRIVSVTDEGVGIETIDSITGQPKTEIFEHPIALQVLRPKNADSAGNEDSKSTTSNQTTQEGYETYITPNNEQVTFYRNADGSVTIGDGDEVEEMSSEMFAQYVQANNLRLVSKPTEPISNQKGNDGVSSVVKGNAAYAAIQTMTPEEYASALVARNNGNKDRAKTILQAQLKKVQQEIQKTGENPLQEPENPFDIEAWDAYYAEVDKRNKNGKALVDKLQAALRAVDNVLSPEEQAEAERKAAEAKRLAAEKARQERMKMLRGLADKYEKKFGMKIVLFENENDIPASQTAGRAKYKEVGDGLDAWVDLKKKTVFMNANVYNDEQRFREKIFHEIVAHVGLRNLLGEDFDRLLDAVWESMTPEQRAERIQYTKDSVGTDVFDQMSEQEKQHYATDEYLAFLSEKYTSLDDADQSAEANEIRSAWQKICDMVRELLGKIFEGEITITDKEIAQLLNASYAKLRQEAEARTDDTNNEKMRQELSGILSDFYKHEQSPAAMDDVRDAVTELLQKYNVPSLQAAMDTINAEVARQKAKGGWVFVEDEEEALIQAIRDIIGDKVKEPETAKDDTENEDMRQDLAGILKKFDNGEPSPGDANLPYDTEDLRDEVMALLQKYNVPSLQAAVDAINAIRTAEAQAGVMAGAGVEEEDAALIQVMRDITGVQPPKAEELDDEAKTQRGVFKITLSGVDSFLERIYRNSRGVPVTDEAINAAYEPEIGTYLRKAVPFVDEEQLKAAIFAAKARLEKIKGKSDKRSNIQRQVFKNIVRDLEDTQAYERSQEKKPLTIEEQLAQAEQETDTNPTEAQKKAENYKQGHVTLWGLPITIENPKGSTRRGTDANGKQWEQLMHHTYGKIRRTEGVDGDHIDVFIGPNLHSDKVFVVDQRDVNTGEFDEHKVMLGFDSMEEAKNGYLSNYEDGWQGMGIVSEVTMDEFKKWIDSSHRKTKPFAEYKSVKPTAEPTRPASEETQPAPESAPASDGQTEAVTKPATNGTIATRDDIWKLVEYGLNANGYKFINAYGDSSEEEFAKFVTKKSRPEAIKWLTSKAKLSPSRALSIYNGCVQMLERPAQTNAPEDGAFSPVTKKYIDDLNRLNDELVDIMAEPEKYEAKYKEYYDYVRSLSDEDLSKIEDELDKYTAEHPDDNLMKSYRSTILQEQGRRTDLAWEEKHIAEQAEPKSEELRKIMALHNESNLIRLKKEYGWEVPYKEAQLKLRNYLDTLAYDYDKLKAVTEEALSLYGQWGIPNMLKDTFEAAKNNVENVEDFEQKLKTQNVTSKDVSKPKINIKQWVENKKDNPNRPVLWGVYHDPSGVGVASNTHILLAMDSLFEKDKEGKIITPTGDEIQEGRFPNWQGIIDGLKPKNEVRVDWNALRRFIAGTKDAMASFEKEDKKNAKITLRMPNGDLCCFDLAHFSAFADAAATMGADVLQYEDGRHAFFVKSGNNIALIMPINHPVLLHDNAFAYDIKAQTNQQPAAAPVTKMDKVKALQEEKVAEKKRATRRASAAAEPTQHIDDVGEKIEGARKDMRAKIAKTLADVTEQSLIENPLGKVYKKPDLKKAVEEGALREQDAMFYESVFALIDPIKPKIKQRDTRMKRWNSDYETPVEKWAKATHGVIETLRQFVELDEDGRDRFMEAAMRDHFPTREEELAKIEERKVWNKDRDIEWGDKTAPNPIWIMNEVLKKMDYSAGDKVDMPFTVITASTSGTSYSINTPKDERLYGVHYDTLEQAMDGMVYFAKLKRGDADLTHPINMFYAKPTKSELGETGRYKVAYGFGGGLYSYKTREFDNKEDADKFAATKRGAIVQPIKEVVRRYGYVTMYRNPLTGEDIQVSDQEFDTKEDAAAYISDEYDAVNDALNKQLEEIREKSGEKKQLTPDEMVYVAFIYANGVRKYGVYIDKKYANNGGQPYLIAEFDKKDDAIAFRDANKQKVYDAYMKLREEGKKVVYFDTGENSRLGEDYRGGRDVTAEEFMNEFGFRGVQFGNWTNQDDRQMAVNQAYDAFKDLAKLIGKSPKAISLNGELGIAFGARGGGSALAHYEPNEVVINLTKTKGAGSLAHEWWHALDNYLARSKGKPSSFVTANELIPIREELRQAFHAMLAEVKKSDYAKRSQSKGTYWGDIIEVTARLFAEWADQELKKNGELNTFLSRGANTDQWQSINYEMYKYLEGLAGREPMSFEEYKEKPESLQGNPYPTAKEVSEFGDVMRNVFDVMQERIDEETGKNVLFSVTRKAEQPRELSLFGDENNIRFSGTEKSNVNLDDIEEVNKRFNKELQEQIDGTLSASHVYQFGDPSAILQQAGIANLPIEMAASRLVDKSMQEEHPFELSEVFDLPVAIQAPLAVFNSATHVGDHVILTELKHGDRNFVAALRVNSFEGKIHVDKIEVNSIRSIHYRRGMNIVNWINNGLGTYFVPDFEEKWLNPLEKELRSKPQYNSADVRAQLKNAAKVVKNSHTTKFSDEKNAKNQLFSVTSKKKDAFDTKLERAKRLSADLKNQNVIDQILADENHRNHDVVNSATSKFAAYNRPIVTEAAFQMLGYPRFEIEGEMASGKDVMANPWDDLYGILKWAIDNKGLDSKYLGRVARQESGMDYEAFEAYTERVLNNKERLFSKEEVDEIAAMLPEELQRDFLSDIINISRIKDVQREMNRIIAMNEGDNLSLFVDEVRSALIGKKPTKADVRKAVSDALNNAYVLQEKQNPKDTSLDDAIRFSVRVNHNSPYLLKKADGSFVDPETGERLGFDHRFMSAGEGNQAHGWGSYFSANDIRIYGGNAKDFQHIFNQAMLSTPEAVALINNAADGAENGVELKRRLEAALKNGTKHYGADSQLAKAAKEAIAAIKPDADLYRHHYDVEIPDNDGTNYLDEEKKLPKGVQERVSNAIQELQREKAKTIEGYNPTDEELKDTGDMYASQFDGRSAYTYFSREFDNDPEKASKFLNKHGIVGIHYDGRLDGECYVIFDENDAKIVDHVRFSTTKRTPKNTSIDDEIRFSIKVNHNSPYLLKKADGSFVDPETGERLGFDHRFMGAGEGSQVHGWGSYFSVKDLRTYADPRNTRYVYKGKTWQELWDEHDNPEYDAASYVIEEMEYDHSAEEALEAAIRLTEASVSFHHKDDAESGTDYAKGFERRLEALKKLDASDFSRNSDRNHHYDVLIPDNDGTNYLEERRRVSADGKKRIADAVRNTEEQIPRATYWAVPKEIRRRVADVVRQMSEEQLDRKHHGNLWLPGGVQSAANSIENNPRSIREIKYYLADTFSVTEAERIAKEANLPDDRELVAYMVETNNNTSGNIRHILAESFDSEEKASRILHKAGYVGIRYNGSWDGECYVIFDDKDAMIVDHVRFSTTKKEAGRDALIEQYQPIVDAAKTNELKAAAIESFISDFGHNVLPAKVVFSDAAAIDMLKQAGLTEEDAGASLKGAKDTNFSGMYLPNGTMMLWGERVTDLKHARKVYVHERQHLFNKTEESINLVPSVILESNPRELAQFLREITGKTYYDKYLKLAGWGFSKLADEVVAYGLEMSNDTPADMDEKSYLRTRGITNEAIIDIIYEEYQRQRRRNPDLVRYANGQGVSASSSDSVGRGGQSAGRSDSGVSRRANVEADADNAREAGYTPKELAQLRDEAIAESNLAVLNNPFKDMTIMLAPAAAEEEMMEIRVEDEDDTEEGSIRFSIVTDPTTLSALNAGETVKVYRAMQLRDGKLYPPMAGKVEGRWQEPIRLGEWEQAVERPELANDKNKFKLDKGNGKALSVAYNPYIHTSRSPLNDQFSSAWSRPELVTVEVEVPVSELTSGYKAEKAKDAVGELDWPSGPVSKVLAKNGNPRKVILSRYDKPIRIVPVDEVAARIADVLKDTNVKVPFNTVTPELREALVRQGVSIGAPQSGNAGESSMPDYEKWKKAEDERIRFSESMKNYPKLRSEIVTDVLVKNAKNNYAMMQAAIKKVGSDLRAIRSAMRKQAGYDRQVVGALLNLYQTLSQETSAWSGGYMPFTTAQIFNQIAKAVGKKDITEEVNKILDYVVAAQLKVARNQWNKLRETPIDKINISGVVTQGKIAIEGQYALKALNEALDKNNGFSLQQLLGNPEAGTDGLIDKLMDMEDKATDESLKLKYKGQWIGYTIAAQYLGRIEHIKEEKEELNQDLQQAYANTNLKSDAQQQLIQNIQEAMRANKMAEAEAYIQSARDLEEYITSQGTKAKGFIKILDDRKQRIRKEAAEDLAGVDANILGLNRGKKRSLQDFADWQFATSRDMQSILRFIGRNTPNGKGYLYNHYFLDYQRAADKERLGLEANTDALSAKVQEIFGDKFKTFEDVSKFCAKEDNRLHLMLYNVFDGIRNVDIPISVDNALYMYAVSKMEDGMMKLNAMNITKQDIVNLTAQIDPKLIQLVDWVQSELFVKLRERYNKTHEVLYGAPMDAIENYFHLRIAQGALSKDVDVADDENAASRLLPGTSTGPIKRRTKNAKPLDILRAGFLTETILHITQMEKWNAFAQWTRDVNILLSDQIFRERLKSIESYVYAKEGDLYKTLKEAMQLANGTYKANKESGAAFLLNVSKGSTSAKINFRLWTAVKQTASHVVVVNYLTNKEAWKEYSKLMLNPKNALNDARQWALDTLPNFRKRVAKRDLGDMRLMRRPSDWEWQRNILEAAGKYGMWSNMYFDTVTCAHVARIAYVSTKADLLKKGFSPEDAEERALLQAEIAFNTSQQSSENGYMAPVQADRTKNTVAHILFRTASMQYTREWLYYGHNIIKKMQPGAKEHMIEFETRRYIIAEGLNAEQARKNAESDYQRSWVKDIVGFILYGWVTNFVWRIYGALPYLVVGDDDDKKKELLKKAVTWGFYASPIAGLLYGGALESALDSRNVAELLDDDMPISGDLQKAARLIKAGQTTAVVSAALSVLIQSTIGFDVAQIVENVTDAVLVIKSKQDIDSAKKAWLVTQSLLQVPKSQYEQMLIDNVIDNRREYRDALKDYQFYYSVHTAPLAWFMRGKEAQEKADKAAKTHFDKLLNERRELRNEHRH